MLTRQLAGGLPPGLNTERTARIAGAGPLRAWLLTISDFYVYINGAGWTRIATINVTVANSPPTIRGMLLEGGQGWHDGVYYFLTGQYGVIRILVDDDDASSGQGNDHLRLDVLGELPPDLQPTDPFGYGYADGEFRIEGPIIPHSDPQSSKHYTPRFRVWDLGQESDTSPFVAVTVTTFGLNFINIRVAPGSTPTGGGNGSETSPYRIRSGTTVTFEITIGGSGAGGGAPMGLKLDWKLYDWDVPEQHDLLDWGSVDINVRNFVTGDWDATFTVALTAQPRSENIYGRSPDWGTGGWWQSESTLKELYFLFSWTERVPAWWGLTYSDEEMSYTSSLWYVEWVET